MVLPIVGLLGLVVVASSGADVLIAVAFMSAVPALAAITAPVVLAAVSASAAVAAAVLVPAITLGQDFGSALPVIMGVIAAAGLSVMAAGLRSPAAPWTAPSATPARAEPSDPDLVDEITGLPTRAAILALPPQVPLDRLVALVDIDNLAAINHHHGRAIGDTLLFAVAGRTRFSLNERTQPDEQWVARWGDDEFLVVMSDASGGAVTDLNGIVAKVNENPIRSDAGLVAATVSCGAVAWRSREHLLDAVARARTCLHRAKARGAGSTEIELP